MNTTITIAIIAAVIIIAIVIAWIFSANKARASYKEEFILKDAAIRTSHKVKHWLQSLSFRTGVIVLLCCIPFYILSFAQMLLPISVRA